MEQTFEPFDLAPPPRVLIPAASPLLRWGMRREMPRYVPAPQPPGTARVVLGDDYYTGPGWDDFSSPQSVLSPDDIFDVPQEQRNRWQAAIDAYSAMQEEIAALMEARRKAAL